MNNPFFESPQNLRKEWKQLRNSLNDTLTDSEQLNIVAKWWAQCPISKYWLNWDDRATWPDPWELIATKNLDYSAIALGMQYTLLLSGGERWTSDRVQIGLASDTEKTMQHLVVIVDNKFVLNVSHANVIDFDNALIIHSRYRYNDKKYIQI